eukprot:CAMPEP_0201508566 /NCGR_PEP_ID=MMETSP0161_2-20130828/1896_1 /ASSEMBLY_ACC=CAM_ASM_000251 /TAXON_ID=180227 /ORGANISM="Neoparamoeba aestuarina, Strain SoJaBio B1-5/56/2" /LENGTH=604 /DNA_ID=CAMNT_0047903279 /DNA_START=64 /DNA_END=1881 /DNA_ORIENTATION=-
MSGLSADEKRELRKKEIEEKRNRLKEIRLRKEINQGRPTKTEKAAKSVTAPKETATRPPAKSVEKLLEELNIGSEPQPEAQPEPEKKEEAGPAVELTIQKNVVTIDVPPQEVIVYSCSAQTDAPEEGEEGLSASTTASSSSSSSSSSSPLLSSSSLGGVEKKVEEKKEEEVVVLGEVERESVFATQNFTEFLDSKIPTVERALYLNNKYDVMIDYVRDLDQKDMRGTTAGETGEIKFVKDFYEPNLCKHRSVMSVSSHPTHPHLVLGAYSEPDSGSVSAAGLVLVWSLQDVLEKPEFVFTCLSPVCSAVFSRFDPRIVVGSTYCGQIVVWDVRAKSEPVMVSPLSRNGHTHPVYAMDIVGTQNAHHLVTASSDGTMCTWRVDDLRAPIDTTELAYKMGGMAAGIGTPVAVTDLEFYGEETNAFLVGSEECTIYKTYRHGSKKGEFKPFRRHTGPITGVSAHPPIGPRDFSEYFLSSSMDWSISLWSHKGQGKHIACFEDADDYVSDVAWSPVHPGVFASVDGSGFLSMWNLNANTEIPVAKEQLSPQALSCLSFDKSGEKLFVGTTPSDEAGGVIKVMNVADWSSPDAGQWSRFEETMATLTVQ